MKKAQIKIILQLTKATQNIILQLNEFLTRLKQYLQSMLSDPQLNDTERRWKFPNDDYTVMAIWLLYDPIAQDLFPEDKKPKGSPDYKPSWGTMAYYDLDRQDWRSFRLDALYNIDAYLTLNDVPLTDD